jgi:hypothetical protein
VAEIRNWLEQQALGDGAVAGGDGRREGSDARKRGPAAGNRRSGRAEAIITLTLRLEAL